MRTGSGTTNACMIYTNCEIENVLIMQTLPAMLRFLLSHALIILLMFSTLPIQFSSTREAHLSQAKYTPRIWSLLFHTNPKKVSVQFCLLLKALKRWNTQPKFQVPVAYPAHLLKTTLNRLYIVQILWYFPRSHFLHSNNLILWCSHNVVFLLQAVLPQGQRLAVKKATLTDSSLYLKILE